MLRFRSLTLSHVAGVRHAHVDFPDSGVMVVHGPNEVGKSTLLRAIRLLLEDTPTSSRKREVKALKDVSVDEPTTISAELTVGETRLRLTKAFNKGSGRCELQVTDPRPESLTGREASDRFAEIMRREVDTDLLEALTVEQGESLDQLAAAGIGPLERALTGGAADPAGPEGPDGSGSAGTVTGTDVGVSDGNGTAALIARISAERARYYTPGGKPSKELKAARDEHAAALTEHDSASSAYRQAQSLISDLERLRAEKKAVAEQEPRARLEAKAAAVDLEQGREQQRQLDTYRAAVTRARQQLELAEQRLQVRDDRVAELAEAVAARDAAVAGAAAATEAAEDEQRQEARLREDLAVARRRARTTAAFVRYLDAVARRATVEKDAEALRAQRTEAGGVAGRIEDVRDQLSRNVVTAEVAAEVHRAEAELTRARGVRDASATVVEVSGAPGRVFHVDGDEHRLDDTPEVLRVTARHELRIGDVTVSITPARSSDEAAGGSDPADDVDRAAAQLQSALAAAGVGTLDALGRAAEERRGLDESLAELRIALSHATGGLTLDDLDRKIGDKDEELRVASADVSSAQESLDREDPEGEVDLPDEESARREDLLARVDACEADIDRIREDLDRLARTGAVAVLSGRVEERKRTEDKVTALTTALGKARDDYGDAHLRDAVADARHDLDKATDALSELAGGPDTPAIDLAVLEGLAAGADARVERLRERADRIGHEMSRANGALGEHSGVAERLESAAARLERAERTAERVGRQARAADALYLAVQAARDDARRRYEAPYRSSVESLARTLYGRAVSVEFDEDLRISRRILDATALDAAQLSGGAREQLAILSRLAVADIVGRGEGVPVVIDDALGFSDTSRIHRMNVVLSQLATTNQVIVLTCDPARFDSVPGATVTSMAELQQ
ncbi:AAA family ATPase [Corynebacterium sp.]|uniref:AAA family ATPase n=1 Tax=Corynebacterium sp. TaxID=1720 RepID=UPI003B3AA839